MPTQLTLAVCCATLVLTICVQLTRGHSHLVKPFPTSRFIGGCRIGGPPQFLVNCPGPCINEQNGKKPDTRSVATFRRGQTIDTAWTKNNHFGGFVRWSIVKKSNMNSHSAHKKGIIAYRCWDAKLINCKKGEFNCVDDREGLAFEDKLTIPKIYPDGDYVLGWAWFGGNGFFGDYYGCSSITIKGGPMEESYKPLPPPKKCHARVDELGLCKREPCALNNNMRTTKKFPKAFQNGKSLPALKASDFGGFPKKTPPPPPMNNNPPPPMNNNPPPPMNNDRKSGNAPGKINLASFVRKYDKTPGNSGGARCGFKNPGPNNVDLFSNGDGTCGIGWIDGGEFVEYSIQFTSGGRYTLSVQVAGQRDGGSTKVFEIYVDGKKKSPLSFQASGSFGRFNTEKVSVGYVSKGRHTVRIVFQASWISFRSLRFTKQ